MFASSLSSIEFWTCSENSFKIPYSTTRMCRLIQRIRTFLRTTKVWRRSTSVATAHRAPPAHSPALLTPTCTTMVTGKVPTTAIQVCDVTFVASELVDAVFGMSVRLSVLRLLLSATHFKGFDAQTKLNLYKIMKTSMYYYIYQLIRTSTVMSHRIILSM